jgi:hypothetical protein
MDSLRDSDFDPGRDAYGDHDPVAVEAPPPIIGQDERRMQVRAYNYWAGGLNGQRFPAPDRLIAGDLPEFADHGVLLHFADGGLDDPAVLTLGAALAEESGGHGDIARLSEVPGRSVLSRITDHYLQIIANEAPIGFEAEFVNQRGATILYRGILLPYSSDGAAIDYIYGVINWKELADQGITDDLILEMAQVLDEPAVPARRAPVIVRQEEWDQVPTIWADGPIMPVDVIALDGTPAGDDADLTPGMLPFADAEPRVLADWLAQARASAVRALASEDRTRQSLYAAIGRAWDFALAARTAPDEYLRLVHEAGLVMRDRAPLLPLVKLVFGADYDKTRLTEYATVLGHAGRIGLGQGDLADFLDRTPGGLKAVIGRERALRRGQTRAELAGRPTWQAQARALPVQPLAALAEEGAEFALVMVRRLDNGGFGVIGEISDDEALLARVAKRLID